MQLIPSLIKVFLKTNVFHPSFGDERHPKTCRVCPRGEGIYGLTLIRLQSAKDQWEGHISGRTGSHGALTGALTDDGEGCSDNSRVMRTTERWPR